MIIQVYKPVGWTMLDLVEYYKKQLSHTKISFSGRLDPLACGVVKLLTDEDISRNIELSNGYKRYKFTFIEGIQTDTYDILGIPQISKTRKEMKEGFYIQEYPPYSSVIIKEYNLPYWQCVKRNLPVLNPPKKEVEIRELILKNVKKVKKDELLKEIKNQFDKLTRDTFRAKEIYEEWYKLENEEYILEEYEAVVSSGCYIRWICSEKGGTAMNIERLNFI